MPMSHTPYPSTAPHGAPGHSLQATTPAPGPVPTAAGQYPLFHFDGGALTWFGVGIGGALITILTLGICYPWAVVMTYRWKTKHTYLHGQQLRFVASAWALFGQWIKWLLLTIITLGIYSFWVYPRMQKWIVENQEIDPHGVRLGAR